MTVVILYEVQKQSRPRAFMGAGVLARTKLQIMYCFSHVFFASIVSHGSVLMINGGVDYMQADTCLSLVHLLNCLKHFCLPAQQEKLV